MDNNLQQEINEITQEINSLRRANDVLSDSQKHINHIKATIIREENELRQQFELQLAAVKARKAEQDQALWNLNDKLNGNRLTIEQKQRLLAEKLKAMQEAEFLNQLEDEIQGYIATLTKWEMVADFQRQDVLEMFKAYKMGKNGFANFNDMGLGKTLIAIMTLALIRLDFINTNGREPRIAWLTKKSLILSTMREFQMWLPGHPAMPFNYETSTAAERTIMFSLAIQTNCTIIANYEVMNTTKEFQETEFDIVIIDEVHKLKGGANPKPSQIFLNAKKVLRRSKFMIFLSGTPMVNHPKEMWSYLHLFDPEKFDNLRKFERMFGSFDPKSGAPIISADKLLKGALQGQCIRRRRDEVGLQLPDLVHNYRFLTMGAKQQAVYNQALDQFFVWLGEQDDAKLLPFNAIIAQWTRLRMINILPSAVHKEIEGETYKIECDESSKIDECMDIIKELTATGEQVIVFSTFNEPLREVIRRCETELTKPDPDTGEADKPLKCELITGSTKNIDTDLRFQNKEIDVLCINLFMGEGLNLQKNPDRWIGGANNVIFLDLWYTPAKNEQAEARIHRRGQTQNCQIHILYNEGSIDLVIAKILEDKSAMFESILERQEIRPASEWKKLLKDLMDPNKKNKDNGN